MKVVGIDVDALRQRYAELETEMATINQVLAIAENTTLPGVTVQERSHRTRHLTHQGVRRSCLVHLLTGPCKPEGIAQVTSMDLASVRSCLKSMASLDLAACDRDSYYTLTSKGRIMAKWHQDNPESIKYHGPNVYNGSLVSATIPRS